MSSLGRDAGARRVHALVLGIFVDGGGPTLGLRIPASYLAPKPKHDSDADERPSFAGLRGTTARRSTPTRSGLVLATCKSTDTYSDRDIDLADFKVYQMCFNGPMEWRSPRVYRREVQMRPHRLWEARIRRAHR